MAFIAAQVVSQRAVQSHGASKTYGFMLVWLCDRENFMLPVALAVLRVEEVFLVELLRKCSQQGNAVLCTEKQ